MLDRSKVMRELHTIADKLFLDSSYEHELARIVWQHIAADPTYSYKVRSLDVPWTIPFWQSRLDQSTTIPSTLAEYTLYAIDGSQIYPDRHHGVSCFLINIGSVLFSYRKKPEPVTFLSEPHIFLGDEYDAFESISPDVVNAIREEWELKTAAQISLDPDYPQLILFDSPLTFWFLDTKDVALRATFLDQYLDTLWQLYAKKIPYAGYISMPRSRDMVGILRAALEKDDLIQQYIDDERVRAIAVAHFEVKEKITKRLVDTTIARWMLQPYQRTILFKSMAPICESYPPSLMPHFCYLHVGSEIVRIEIPAWIAEDERLVDLICQMCLDQAIKGNGYTVALAEAHEMAVVKNHDREFFYHMITKVGIGYKKRFTHSQKSLKKRGLGV
jgi:hypothetical protein